MKKSLGNPLIAIASAAALAVSLSGCGGGSSDGSGDDPGGTIAFATISTQIPLIQALNDKVTAFMKGKGVDVVVQDANFDSSQQAQQLQQAIEAHQIDAAWIFPVAPEALASVVKLAQERKVPLAIDADPSDLGLDGPQPGIVFSVPSYGEYGTTIGEEAAQCAKEHGATKAMLLEAPDAAGGAKQIHDNITSSLKSAAPNASIVATAQASDLQTAQTKVSQLLISNPAVTVVVASNDETALGAVAAYKAGGKTPACVIVGGGGPDVVDAQESGDITTIVAFDYAAEAQKTGAELTRLMSDPTAKGGVFSIPVTVIEKQG